MRKLLAFLFLFAFTTSAIAQPIGAPVEWTEEDGSPVEWPYKVKVTNGTLTKNNDGTVSLSTGGGAVEGTAVLSTGEGGASKYLREDGDGTSSWQTPAGTGDVTAVGDCASGLCFDGSVDGGTYLDFYDAQGRTRVIGGNTAAEVTLTLPVTKAPPE